MILIVGEENNKYLHNVYISLTYSSSMNEQNTVINIQGQITNQ